MSWVKPQYRSTDTLNTKLNNTANYIYVQSANSCYRCKCSCKNVRAAQMWHKTLIRTGTFVALAKFNRRVFYTPRNERFLKLSFTNSTSRKCKLKSTIFLGNLRASRRPRHYQFIYLFISFVRRYQHHRASLKFE